VGYFVNRVQELERQNKTLKLEVDSWFNKAQEIYESMTRQDKVIDKFRQQNKRYREALEEIMKIHDNHEWNLYGLAYAIAERTLLELEGEE